MLACYWDMFRSYELRVKTKSPTIETCEGKSYNLITSVHNWKKIVLKIWGMHNSRWVLPGPKSTCYILLHEQSLWHELLVLLYLNQVNVPSRYVLQLDKFEVSMSKCCFRGVIARQELRIFLFKKYAKGHYEIELLTLMVKKC